MIEESLKYASQLPYNTAATIIRDSGTPLDARYGGNCIYQLSELERLLHENGDPNTTTFFIPSVVNNGEGHTARIPHFAMLYNQFYYLDPFIQLAEPIRLDKEPLRRLYPTLLDNTFVKVDRVTFDNPKQMPTELEVSLLALEKDGVNYRTQLNYTYGMPQASVLLPSNKEAMTKALPNYKMQFVSTDGHRLYSIWYYKKPDDIRITYSEPRTGFAGKVPESDLATVIGSIESQLDLTLSEIIEMFRLAKEVEALTFPEE